jgi:hypothetical protein
MSTDLLSSLLAMPELLREIYKDLASPSVKAIGDALGTVFEYGTSFLLPLKLKNEKTKETFAHNLEEYRKKLESIPESDRCEVHPQIGTPIIDRLTYTTNEEIADMFTSLLASASNKNTVKYAHPSFVGVIENLSVDEARIISYLKGKKYIEFCTFRAYSKTNSGFDDIVDHVTIIPLEVDLLYPDNIKASISNLIRLGFLSEPPGLYRMDKTTYERIRNHNHFKELQSQQVPSFFKSIECKEGYYLVTPYAELFLNAVFY